jgi:hypothetical protein
MTKAKTKGYRAIADVSFPKPIAQISEDDWATEGVNYPAGSLIPEDHLTPHARKQAAAGELSHVIEPVDEDSFDQEFEHQQSGEPTTGVFIAEHEAEAHALRMGGHIVVPQQQALEAASTASEHHARYQAAAKEYGLDRRPAQEAMAAAETDEGRVPDEFLHGMETRTGLPHHRGPGPAGVQQEDQEENEDSGSESEDSTAPRPRPDFSGQTSSDSDEDTDDENE